MFRLLVIADDFTGGLDTGVQFAARGITTCVVTDPSADFAAEACGSEVLVVVAETRHLPAAEAYRAVYGVVRKGISLGVGHIYKKTDSALRGNIGAELAAVLEASGAETLPFLPALPAMRRVTRGGIHYIDGVPVAESVFGKDPFEPVTESEVVRLIRLQSGVPAALTAPGALQSAKGIAVLDAETEEDLRALGRRLAENGQLAVSAGCAGFGAVLPEALGLQTGSAPEKPRLENGLFVLCGSVNPITQRQLALGEQEGFLRVHITPEEKLTPGWAESEAGQARLAEWRSLENGHPWMILDANDPVDTNAETAAHAKREGLSIEQVRSRISGALGGILAEMLRCPAERTLLITGGDTLLQSMNRMGVHRMTPLAEVFPGVVLSRVELGGRLRHVITKSGGFGTETLLGDLKRLMENS